MLGPSRRVEPPPDQSIRVLAAKPMNMRLAERRSAPECVIVGLGCVECGVLELIASGVKVAYMRLSGGYAEVWRIKSGGRLRAEPESSFGVDGDFV